MRGCAFLHPALLAAAMATLGPLDPSQAQTTRHRADPLPGHHVRTLQHRIDLHREHSLIRQQAKSLSERSSLSTRPAAGSPPVRQRASQAPVQLDHSRERNAAIADLLIGGSRTDTRPGHRRTQQPGQRPRLSTGETISPPPRVIQPQPYRQLVIRPVRSDADHDTIHRPVVIYSATAYDLPRREAVPVAEPQAVARMSEQNDAGEQRRFRGAVFTASAPPVRGYAAAEKTGFTDDAKATTPPAEAPSYDTAVPVDETGQ